jgi:hypothetical protein
MLICNIQVKGPIPLGHMTLVWLFKRMYTLGEFVYMRYLRLSSEGKRYREGVCFMQDKEFQQPTVQHKKAHNWALYASFSASCINILLVVSSLYLLPFTYFFTILIISVLLAIGFGHVALYNSRHDAELQPTRAWSIMALIFAYAFPLLSIGLICTSVVTSCAGKWGTGGCS